MRKLIRFRNHDYSNYGYYFVTICTKLRSNYFKHTETKQMIENQWRSLPEHFPNIELDKFVVMPDHFHGILIICKKGAMNCAPTSTITLSKIIRHFKAKSTKLIRNKGNVAFGWQRNYHDRIIRSQEELLEIRAYIHNNPSKIIG